MPDSSLLLLLVAAPLERTSMALRASSIGCAMGLGAQSPEPPAARTSRASAAPTGAVRAHDLEYQLMQLKICSRDGYTLRYLEYGIYSGIL